MNRRIYSITDIETVQCEIVKNGEHQEGKFPPIPSHKIVGISMLTCRRSQFPDDDVIEIASLGSAQGNETEMLKAFVSYTERVTPCHVTFNGRAFDLPVIKMRCLINGVPFSSYFKTGTKWDSYRSRYASDWHMDLLDYLSDFGASQRFSLDLIASGLGLPGKIGVSGKDVLPLYQAGKLDEIKNYCECDVANTYGVFLRVMHLNGEISSEGFAKSAKMFIEFLEKEAVEKHHLREFLDNIDYDRFLGVSTTLKEEAKPDNVRRFPRSNNACPH